MDTLPSGEGALPLNRSRSSPVVHHYHQSLSSSLVDVGIFRDTLLPSVSLHTSLALAAYAGGRLTNRVETKDWLWPAGQVINAWWSSVGRRFAAGVPASRIWPTLSRPERWMLFGVSLWGSRLFYRLITRSANRGKDDERYESAKKESGFWDRAFFTLYLPEALFQTVICLPFTAPFRHQGAVLTGYHPVIQALSVGLFSAGFALEVLADYQLDQHKGTGDLETGMLKDGVWSICRHPNYLGDALVHLSFPIMLFGSDLLAPIELLGPIANYIFLRYIGGDKQTEVHQHRRYSASNPPKMIDFEQYKQAKNSFWPDASALQNTWAWIVVGCGAAGVALEAVVDSFF